MALGLPSVNIVFKQEGITAIERGERGIVALVLKDTKALGGHTVYDITDCPEELSEENYNKFLKVAENELPDPKGTDKFFIDLLGNMAKSKYFKEWSERLLAIAVRCQKYYDAKN
mgnify:CR=1 FL=1